MSIILQNEETAILKRHSRDRLISRTCQCRIQPFLIRLVFLAKSISRRLSCNERESPISEKMLMHETASREWRRRTTRRFPGKF